MKRLLLFFSILISAITVSAQNASITGYITDQNTGEVLPFVNVELLVNNKLFKTTSTDFSGKYILDKLKDGEYAINVASVGYNSKRVDSIIIKNQKNILLNIDLYAGVDLQSVEIITYSKPIIDRDNTVSRETVERKQIAAIPGRSANSISSNVYGVSTDSRNGYGVNIENREQYNATEDNLFFKVDDEPLSTFSIDVDRASYSNVRRYLQDGSLPPIDAVRIEEMVNYFSYDYPNPTGDTPFSISTEHTICPWNTKHQLVHIGIQGKKINSTETAPNNLVFLIDVSGSMNSADKLGLLKSGFNMLVDQLREQDRVAIVVYAGAAGVVLPSTSGKNKAEIKSKIQGLSAGGSTAGGRGIELAYSIAKENFIEGGNNRVILATDGDFNVGISNQDELIKLIGQKRDDDIFLSVLGFGSGNLQDGKMEQIADKGNGNYSYIDNVLEAKKVLVNEFQSTLITIAKDVKTQIEFNPQHVLAYRMVGYINRKLDNEDFNNDKKDAGELGAGHTVTMIYEIVPVGSDENFFGKVDDLKYQKKKNKEKVKIDVGNNEYSKELATIKLRYKEPTASKSKLISHVIPNKCMPIDMASENCRFSASVAQFGMLLRKSDFSGEANFKSTLALAKAAKGRDEEGYRAEFIKLLETAELLNK